MLRATVNKFSAANAVKGVARRSTVQIPAARKHQAAPTIARCASTSSSSAAEHPRVAYGALAGVAFFSAALGYSISEWRQKGASGTKNAEASTRVRTWEDVQYGSHEDVKVAIEELKKVLPREGAVDTVCNLASGRDPEHKRLTLNDLDALRYIFTGPKDVADVWLLRVELPPESSACCCCETEDDGGSLVDCEGCEQVSGARDAVWRWDELGGTL